MTWLRVEAEWKAPLVPEISDADLNSLADEIASLYRGNTLDLAVTIGRMVVDRLYGGSP